MDAIPQAPRYLVSRRSADRPNTTFYLMSVPKPGDAFVWTDWRSLAARLKHYEARQAADRWNALPAARRDGILARVEDADPPAPVTGEAA